MRLVKLAVAFMLLGLLVSGCQGNEDSKLNERDLVEKTPIDSDYAKGSKDCVDVYPTDIQPSDVVYRERYGVLSVPPPTLPDDDLFFATGVRIKGVEPTASDETTRIALFCEGSQMPDYIQLDGKEFEPEESWTFENQQHIFIFLVPVELVTERLWERVEVEMYSDRSIPDPE